MIKGEISQTEWREALKPLLVNINSRTGEAAISVEIGDVTAISTIQLLLDEMLSFNPTLQPFSPPVLEAIWDPAGS